LRLRVLAALALTIGLLLSTFVYAFVEATNRRIEAERALTVERATLLFDVQLRTYTELMSSTLEATSRDDALKREMLAGDSDAMFARLKPMFEKLRAQFGVEHMYVHGADRVNVVRVHEPKHKGDEIKRVTLKTAERTGAPAAGIEQGPTGQSVLRVVYPWRSDGRIIGYLELGTEFDKLARRVRDVMGVDILVFVYKKLLTRELWERRNKKPRQTDWEDFPTVVLVDSTTANIPHAIETRVASDQILDQSLVARDGDRNTQLISLPLKDVDGRTLGGIFVLRDVTDIFSHGHRSLILVAGACLVFGALVLGFFYVLLGRIQRSLDEKNAKLEDANATLEQRVESRTQELKAAQEQLVEAARHVGQAEVAANVLHNVGNVLNSTNVSVQQLEHLIEQSSLATLSKLGDLLEERKSDLAAFLTSDVRGKQIPSYVQMLAADLVQERAHLTQEVKSLANNVGHLKSVIQAQQSYARRSKRIEIPADPKDVIDDALHISGGRDWRQHSIRIVRDLGGVHRFVVDKQKLLQVLVNIVTNAKQAVMASRSPDRCITFRVRCKPTDPQRLLFEIEDTGVGIPAEHLPRIFQHGFTTKQGGNGFGLHSAALIAKELGGSLVASSAGVDRGAVFTLDLPIDGASSLSALSQRGVNLPAPAQPSAATSHLA
jgi:signal transduction histidine kinase